MYTHYTHISEHNKYGINQVYQLERTINILEHSVS